MTGLVVRHLPSTGYLEQRWRNGGGSTREIARHPDGADHWLWRLSIARVESDGPFSSFPGIDRHLLLLSGNGLRLRFDDGTLQVLMPPHGALRFAGDEAVHGELIDGPVTDFNLMWRRDRVTADVWLRPLVGSGVLAVAAGETWAMHLVAGRLRLGDGAATGLASGDTAMVRNDTEATHLLRYDGTGTAIVLRTRPAIQSG